MGGWLKELELELELNIFGSEEEIERKSLQCWAEDQEEVDLAGQLPTVGIPNFVF